MRVRVRVRVRVARTLSLTTCQARDPVDRMLGYLSSIFSPDEPPSEALSLPIALALALTLTLTLTLTRRG